MSCFSEIEKQMKEGDVLKLDQSNDEYSYGVILVANIIRNQENIYGEKDSCCKGHKYK